ncbi:MAG TPA: spore germination protein GerW family protein [Clostridia bacterium]|nr:spore germination protein GerW family protein [Clostridia bacterium]
MSVNVNVGENIDLLFQNLEDFIKNKTIFGEPMQIGDATLIPVVDVSFGLGSGGGDGSDNKGNGGVGGGAGIGAKASPTAIIVMKDNNVEVLPIRKSSGLEKLLEMVPDLVDRVRAEMPTKNKDEDKE